MLIEVRKLIFADDLLQHALIAHCKAEGVEIPNSQIQKVRYTAKPDGGSSLVVGFVTADPNKPFELHWNEAFVLGAMIRACKSFGVPLPRDAKKMVQLTEQGLAMTVSMKIADAKLPNLKTAAVG